MSLVVETVDLDDVEHFSEGAVGCVSSSPRAPLKYSGTTIGGGISKKMCVAGSSVNEDVRVIVSEGAFDEAVRCCGAGRPFDGGKGVKRKSFDLTVSADPNGKKIIRVKLSRSGAHK